MSKKITKLLAVSAVAVSAAFIGYGQASAFSFAPTFMLAQSSGGAGTGSGQGGVPSTANPSAKSGSAGSPTGGANQPAPGSTTPGATTPGATSPNAASPSAGVPAACAAITSATERQSCIQRQGRK